MDNATVEKLERKFPGEGVQRFRKILELGGWVTTSQNVTNRELDYPDGLDLVGALDPNNKAISAAHKDQIREVAGITETADGKAKTTKEK
jgi:hypothetical protein